jgi:lipoate-protein ligase B
MEALDVSVAAGRTIRERRRVEALWLGRIGYGRALVVQREAAARVARGGPETLLLLEHEPVFTLGRNASEADVLFTPEGHLPWARAARRVSDPEPRP